MNAFDYFAAASSGGGPLRAQFEGRGTMNALLLVKRSIGLACFSFEKRERMP